MNLSSRACRGISNSIWTSDATPYRQPSRRIIASLPTFRFPHFAFRTSLFLPVPLPPSHFRFPLSAFPPPCRTIPDPRIGGLRLADPLHSGYFRAVSK